MANKTLLYIGAGILFLIGLCLVGYGGVSVMAPPRRREVPPGWRFGLGFATVGILVLRGRSGHGHRRLEGDKDRSRPASDHAGGFAGSDQNRRSQMPFLRRDFVRKGHHPRQRRADGQLPVLSHHLSNDRRT